MYRKCYNGYEWRCDFLEFETVDGILSIAGRMAGLGECGWGTSKVRRCKVK